MLAVDQSTRHSSVALGGQKAEKSKFPAGHETGHESALVSDKIGWSINNTFFFFFGNNILFENRETRLIKIKR